MIIGICGAMGSGKSTLADAISYELNDCVADFYVASFSYPIKDIVADLFGLPAKQLTFAGDLDYEKYKQLEHPCGKTYRELLQIVGTDFFRSIHPKVWIDAMRLLVSDGDDYVISDVRFQNELDFIKEMGGLSIGLARNIQHNSHSSENVLAVVNACDYTIKNQSFTDVQLVEKGLEIVEEWLCNQKNEA